MYICRARCKSDVLISTSNQEKPLLIWLVFIQVYHTEIVINVFRRLPYIKQIKIIIKYSSPIQEWFLLYIMPLCWPSPRRMQPTATERHPAHLNEQELTCNKSVHGQFSLGSVLAAGFMQHRRTSGCSVTLSSQCHVSASLRRYM